jgi:hypothetical protein
VTEGSTSLADATSSTEAEDRGAVLTMGTSSVASPTPRSTTTMGTSSVATPIPRKTPPHGRRRGSRPGRRRPRPRQDLVLVMVSTVYLLEPRACECDCNFRWLRADSGYHLHRCDLRLFPSLIVIQDYSVSQASFKLQYGCVVVPWNVDAQMCSRFMD